MRFNELKLDPRIQQSIDKSGFIKPTEIQQQAIPVVLSGADLMASAQTGTGKTAAFVLPALQRILRPSKKSIVRRPNRDEHIAITERTRFGSKTINADPARYPGHLQTSSDPSC